MTMVALDAARTKKVPSGSLEARWMVNEGDVSDYLKGAKKQPKMQDMMAGQEEKRLADEKVAAKVAAAEAKRRLQVD